MGRQEEILKERLRKLELLRKDGINPYPQKIKISNKISEIKSKFSKLKEEEKSKTDVSTAGRLMSLRSFGKISFGTLDDGNERIQVLLQDKETPKKCFDFLKNYSDIGDFLSVKGKVTRTKRGELSILARDISMVSKSLQPLPEKWHGLQDKEDRYRKRYLDLIMGPEVRETFRKRSKIIDTVRSHLKDEGFLEVETPTLQSTYGGASATPFQTHLNALDIDLFLSISPELYLKRLIVGGYDAVFTICKNFRNEGIDFQHNPEFTMLEYYKAYENYEYHMKFTEELFKKLIKELDISKGVVELRGKKINLNPPFKRITFRDLILKEAKIDINKANSFETLKKEILSKKLKDVDIRSCSHYGALLDELYKRVARPKLTEPTFLTHYPVEMIALAKRNEEDHTKINSVQLLIDGAEIIKAYDELNDPIDQDNRLREQEELLRSGDDEAMPMDEDFVNALKQGMPPTAGYGMGIDRLTMLLTGEESIRDVILFPFMKPLTKENSKKLDSKKSKGGK